MDVVIGVGALLVVLAGLVAAAVYWRVRARLRRRPLDAFYDPPFDLPAGTAAEAGAVVRVEALTGAPRGLAMHRLVYLGADEAGRLEPISAISVVPAGRPVPPGGWPVITVCHGTVGLARQGAPSLAPIDPVWLPGVPREMLGSFAATALTFARAGFACVGTDYRGLGIDGGPSYMIGAIEARNAIDAVRALRRSGITSIGNETFAWGHSQGGHTAAFVRQIAPGYAPDVPIGATILVAPAIGLDDLFGRLLERDTAGPLTALIMIVIASWSRYYPDADPAAILTPLGVSGLDSVATSGVRALAGQWRRYKPSDVIASDPRHHAAWARIIAENTPDTTARPGPLLVIQGLADEIIGPATTEAFARAWQQAGNVVTLSTYPGKTHFTAQDASVAQQRAFAETQRGPGLAPPLD